METAPHHLNGGDFGDWLRGFRAARRLSLSGAAKGAGLSRSTLLRWEAGAHLPRLPELEAFLAASGATDRQREEALIRIGAPRAAQALKREAAGSAGEPIPPVSGGDLLRAMRLRRRLTQEQLAAHMGVPKSVVSRWESAEAAFPSERLEDLTDILGAQPEERKALANGPSLLTPGDSFPLLPPHFEAVDQALLEMELHLKREPYDPLTDLRYLGLKARIWPDARRYPHMREHLARSNVSYAHYLLEQGRYPEARGITEQALEIARSGDGGEGPEVWWAWAVEYLAQATARMESRAAPLRAVEILDLWDGLPSAIHSPSSGPIDVYLRRHKALYLGQAGSYDAALEALREAKRIAHERLYTGEIHGCGIYEGRILFRAGRFNEAVDALPLPRVLGKDTDEPGEVMKEQLVRVEALLAVNDRSEAQHWLSEAQALLDDHNVEPLRHRWETLVERFNEGERGYLIGRRLADQVLRTPTAHPGAGGGVETVPRKTSR